MTDNQVENVWKAPVVLPDKVVLEQRFKERQRVDEICRSENRQPDVSLYSKESKSKQ